MIDVRTTPAPIEVVTPIKPSEAIRLGCLIAPEQIFNLGYLDYDSRQGACAYGAMALGFGSTGRFDDAWVDAGSVAGRLHVDDVGSAEVSNCPDCDDPRGSLLTHLNDDHRWSRERIADYLEGLGL